MRLNELYTLRHLPLRAPDSKADLSSFAATLSDHGFTSLGTGAYGTVFTNPALGYAVKIFDTYDAGYSVFYHFATRNPSCVNLPRFRGGIKNLNENFYVCRMELLAKIGTQRMRSVHKLHDAAILFSNGTENAFEECGETDPDDRQLFETFVKLCEVKKSAGIRLDWDIHPGNVMLRGNTCVITDPFAG